MEVDRAVQLTLPAGEKGEKAFPSNMSAAADRRRSNPQQPCRQCSPAVGRLAGTCGGPTATHEPPQYYY